MAALLAALVTPARLHAVEREDACDDLVLAAGIAPSSYAADLLEVARWSAARVTPAGALGMVDRSSTETRLRRILDPATARRPLGARFRLAAGAVALGSSLALACTTSPSASPAPRATGFVPAAIAQANAGTAPADRANCPARVRGPATAGAGASFYTPPSFEPADRIEVEGGLAPAAVERAVQRHLGDLERCYQQRLLVQPALAGKVVMHWNIAPTGEVVEQCITTDTVGDKEIRACVNALVAGTRYPAPSAGSVNVSYPFTFSPAPGC